MSNGAHDRQAQAAFDARWRPALMAFFRRRVRNGNDAEDLTQETLFRLLRNDDGDHHPDAYVFQVAQNLLVDRSRRHKVREDYLKAIEFDETRDLDPLDPARIAQGRSDYAAFLAGVEALPEQTRAIFILYRMENMTQDAIGEAFGLSTRAVKYHVAKAMAHLARTFPDSRR